MQNPWAAVADVRAVGKGARAFLQNVPAVLLNVPVVLRNALAVLLNGPAARWNVEKNAVQDEWELS